MSDYFRQVKIEINKTFPNPVKDVSNNESCDEHSMPELREDYDLVCFGLGRFTENLLAFHQLAFVLSIREHLVIGENGRGGNCILYDPCFTKREHIILEKLHCSVLKENTEGRYPIKNGRRTIFYLPHCPNILTNNLLKSNWSPGQLSNLLLINNSFQELSVSKPRRLLHSDSNLILDILPYTKEIPLIDSYYFNGIFNDLSLHVFPLSKGLPDVEDEYFWKKSTPTSNTTKNNNNNNKESQLDNEELILSQRISNLCLKTEG